ncbi:MAG: type II secretion system F family protein [Rhodospirillales bacterium]|nr:type II secretion system F family protein [Rhodospirillales bacterium]
MEKYKYKAINRKGRTVRGVIGAASEADLYSQLQVAGLELVQCRQMGGGSSGVSTLLRKKIKIRDLIQLFMHMEQMQSAGVPMLDALADIRDSTDNTMLRDMMSEIHRDVSEGSSLSEAMLKHPKVFKPLYISLVASGEETGNLTVAYLNLVKFLKWVDLMQSKVRKATRYPMIVTVVVILTITIMMGYVVPQIVGFIKNLDQELPFYTTSLMATSDFFANPLFHLFDVPVPGGAIVLATPVALYFIVKYLKKVSEAFAYRVDALFLKLPIMGPLIRKINVARFCQTFAALFSSGIDVLNALRSARNTVGNLALSDALEQVQVRVRSGEPLSAAFNASGEFPSMVVRMIRVGEESGNLTVVLEQVAEFYTNDVDEAVQGLITMIEPLLTAVLGIMILWIAVAVFGPIYASFENLD